MQSRFAHQFALQRSACGATVSFHSGPSPKNGSNVVSKIMMMYWGVRRKYRTTKQAIRLNLFKLPLVALKVTYDVRIPLHQSKEKNKKAPLKKFLHFSLGSQRHSSNVLNICESPGPYMFKLFLCFLLVLFFSCLFYMLKRLIIIKSKIQIFT